MLLSCEKSARPKDVARSRCEDITLKRDDHVDAQGTLLLQDKFGNHTCMYLEGHEVQKSHGPQRPQRRPQRVERGTFRLVQIAHTLKRLSPHVCSSFSSHAA